MTKHRIYSVSVASVYPYYVAKAEKKGRTKAEIDEVICWLTGHSHETLDDQLAKKTNFEDFFAHAPQMNPSRSLRPTCQTSQIPCNAGAILTGRSVRKQAPA